MLIIPVTTSAASVVLTIDRYTYDYYCALQIVGTLTTEVVALQQPIVAVPDPANDAHWGPIIVNSVTWQLSATNNLFDIRTRMIIKVKKPASGSNAFGVNFMTGNGTNTTYIEHA